MHENLVRPDLVGPVLARALGDSRWQRPQAALTPGGKSNLTFELTSEAGTVVLRRPPDGPLLPRALSRYRLSVPACSACNSGVTTCT